MMLRISPGSLGGAPVPLYLLTDVGSTMNSVLHGLSTPMYSKMRLDLQIVRILFGSEQRVSSVSVSQSMSYLNIFIDGNVQDEIGYMLAGSCPDSRPKSNVTLFM